jgi:hypothetical protein
MSKLDFKGKGPAIHFKDNTLDEQIEKILGIVADEAAGLAGCNYYDHDEMVETYLEAKQSILALIVQSNNRVRIDELSKFKPFYDGDHSNCIDKRGCIGYENARSDYDNEREIRINQLQTILNKGGKE